MSKWMSTPEALKSRKMFLKSTRTVFHFLKNFFRISVDKLFVINVSGPISLMVLKSRSMEKHEVSDPKATFDRFKFSRFYFLSSLPFLF